MSKPNKQPKQGQHQNGTEKIAAVPQASGEWGSYGWPPDAPHADAHCLTERQKNS